MFKHENRNWFLLYAVSAVIVFWVVTIGARLMILGYVVSP
jgi:hypothetical protein